MFGAHLTTHFSLTPRYPLSGAISYHDHLRQLDFRQHGWGQGDGDAGSDRDGGARGLDGATRRAHSLQLQLQWGVNHCRALETG